MKKAAVHIPSSVINFRNQKLLRHFQETQVGIRVFNKRVTSLPNKTCGLELRSERKGLKCRRGLWDLPGSSRAVGPAAEPQAQKLMPAAAVDSFQGTAPPGSGPNLRHARP